MLAAKSYVPLLRTKVAEVEAYRQLSDECKLLTFPIFLLRPWQNGKHLQLTLDKVCDAVEGHPFGIGLDADAAGANNARPAQSEFEDLFDDTLGFRAFFDLVEQLDDAIPVLQPTLNVDVLVRQLANADNLDRGLVVHQRRDARIPISNTILSLPTLPNDTTFVVDAGWSRDFLMLQSWTLSQCARINKVLPEAEIVVMSSSFPDSFSHIEGTSEEQAHETHVFNAVKQRLQAADLTLGDWASTRLPQSGGGGTIPSRIDVPKPASWQIFRADPANDQGYPAIAKAAIAHPVFNSLPDCMGRRLIAETDGQGAGVTGTQKNTRSRINIHMTLQSGATQTIKLDEVPYED